MIHKLTIPVGIVASLLVSAATAGGTFAALKAKDDALAAQVAVVEAKAAEAKRKAEAVDADVVRARVQAAETKATLERVVRSLDRIEDRLGTKP